MILANKIGIQYGFWSQDRSADFVSYVTKVAKLGFDVLEISAYPLLELTAAQRNTIKIAAENEGIELSFQTSIPKIYDISAADASVRKRGVAYLKQNIQMVRDMGGKMLSGVIYAAWGDAPEDPDKDHQYYLDNSVGSMKEVVKLAEDLGVQLNVEALNRFEQFLINTGEQALEYIRMVDSPCIKVELDTFHMNIEEDDLGQTILNVGDQLGHFHLSENNRKLPGKGHIPWSKVAQALRQINYSGYLVIESFVNPGGELARLLKIWRKLEDNDLDTAAKESLEFLKACWR